MIAVLPKEGEYDEKHSYRINATVLG